MHGNLDPCHVFMASFKFCETIAVAYVLTSSGQDKLLKCLYFVPYIIIIIVQALHGLRKFGNKFTGVRVVRLPRFWVMLSACTIEIDTNRVFSVWFFRRKKQLGDEASYMQWKSDALFEAGQAPTSM